MSQKISPIQLLIESYNSKATCCLQISGESVSWKVYFRTGRIQYAECSIQTMTQLKCYLLHHGWRNAVAALKNLPPLYLKTQAKLEQNPVGLNLYKQSLLWLLDEKHIDHFQLAQIIEDITQDAIEHCLWLKEGIFSCACDRSIQPWTQGQIGEVLSLDVLDLVEFLSQKLEKWQNCSKQVFSPHQRPYLLDFRDINKSLPTGVLSQKAFSELAELMRRGLSFRQLSIFLNKDELHIAQILSPYIESKIIHLRNPQSPLDKLPTIPKSSKENISQSSQLNKTYKIVCIDDSPTILSEIKRFLNEDRYQVTAIDDPVQASAVIFRLQPDLILMDITMPRINGYKLCNLLRGSNAFNETPIIMVTGNTGLIDKARAKMAGATDYFTKPFTKEGLMALVDKYLT